MSQDEEHKHIVYEKHEASPAFEQMRAALRAAEEEIGELEGQLLRCEHVRNGLRNDLAAVTARAEKAEEALRRICDKRASGRSPCGCYAAKDPDWHNVECQVAIARAALASAPAENGECQKCATCECWKVHGQATPPWECACACHRGECLHAPAGHGKTGDE